MHKTYVTFGHNHTHHIDGKTYDKDCVAVIYANDEIEGRNLAFKIFGTKFCFEYPENSSDARSGFI